VYWTLFFSALISSTLMPGGSEALLSYLIIDGGNVYMLVAIATLGNVLGSLITYGMGRFLNQTFQNSRFRMNPKHLSTAETWFAKFGQPALIFAWLPIVGDPLCFIAGMMRSHVMLFVLLITIGKFLRYAVLAAIVGSVGVGSVG